jgi:hypothetical protein
MDVDVVEFSRLYLCLMDIDVVELARLYSHGPGSGGRSERCLLPLPLLLSSPWTWSAWRPSWLCSPATCDGSVLYLASEIIIHNVNLENGARILIVCINCYYFFFISSPSGQNFSN